MATIGQNIKRLRESYNWTQEMLAEKTDTNRGLLSSYETDRRKPKIAFLRKMSLLFNVSVSEIDESLKGITINGGMTQRGKRNIQIGNSSVTALEATMPGDAEIDESAIRADERKSMIDEIMNSDLDAETKVKVYAILNQ